MEPKDIFLDLTDESVRICFGRETRFSERLETSVKGNRNPVLEDLLVRNAVPDAKRCLLPYGSQTPRQILDFWQKNGFDKNQIEGGWRGAIFPVLAICPSANLAEVPLERLTAGDVLTGFANDPNRLRILHSYQESWLAMLKGALGVEIPENLFKGITIAGLLALGKAPPAWTLRATLPSGESSVLGKCTERPFDEGTENEHGYLAAWFDPKIAGIDTEMQIGLAVGAGGFGTRGLTYLQTHLLHPEKTEEIYIKTEKYIRQKTLEGGGKVFATEKMIEVMAGEFVQSAGIAADWVKEICGNWTRNETKILQIAFAIDGTSGSPNNIRQISRAKPSSFVQITDGGWHTAIEF